MESNFTRATLAALCTDTAGTKEKRRGMFTSVVAATTIRDCGVDPLIHPSYSSFVSVGVPFFVS